MIDDPTWDLLVTPTFNASRGEIRVHAVLGWIRDLASPFESIDKRLDLAFIEIGPCRIRLRAHDAASFASGIARSSVECKERMAGA
jgi:hypothetical protein